MNTPRLWYAYQLASHHDRPNTAGIAQERHQPGGWDPLWEKGGHGQPPLKALSECEAPLILHNPFGQVPGMPVQWLLRERPWHYTDGLVHLLRTYEGPIILYSGSPHNSPGWDHAAEVKAADELAVAALYRKLVGLPPITIVLDALTECGAKAAECAAFIVALRGMGFKVGCEGALWDANADLFTPVLDVVMHLRTSLYRQLANRQDRKGVRPLNPAHEQIVWINDPADKTVETSAFEAGQVLASGATVDYVVALDTTAADVEFVKSAARPMSAAISCGMTADQVWEFFGKGAK